MNQLERVRGLLERLTYKPGWRVTVSDLEYPYTSPSAYRFTCNQIYISVEARLEDSYNPNKKITVHSGFTIDEHMIEGMKDDQIVSYVFKEAIWKLEKHEFDEWFKLDGVCVFDPHPELKEKTA